MQPVQQLPPARIGQGPEHRVIVHCGSRNRTVA
jgi:hypothetical protein